MNKEITFLTKHKIIIVIVSCVIFAILKFALSYLKRLIFWMSAISRYQDKRISFIRIFVSGFQITKIVLQYYYKLFH